MLIPRPVVVTETRHNTGFHTALDPSQFFCQFHLFQFFALTLALSPVYTNHRHRIEAIEKISEITLLARSANVESGAKSKKKTFLAYMYAYIVYLAVAVYYIILAILLLLIFLQFNSCFVHKGFHFVN